MKYLYPVVLVSLFLITGCIRGVESTLSATQTPVPSPLNITYCDIKPADLCLEGFGQEAEDKMLILFKADDHDFADIFLRAKQAEGEFDFECQQSKNFPENVYCLGDASPEGESIKLQIHSTRDDELIAIGVFIVQYGALPAPDVDFGIATPTVTPTAPIAVSSHTPEPAYPNYPNPAYPNSTEVP